ncbi:MAG: alpha/beta fold hydrolase [Dehalococcoidia bacterium]
MAARFDSPTGRYVHLELDGLDHRVYFEEAGSGIPLLLQHTAGAHGAQWRHLFENPAITDHFRLIAYDLPYHGKSLPPTGKQWWAEEYRLTTSQLMAVPPRPLDRPRARPARLHGLQHRRAARPRPRPLPRRLFPGGHRPRARP